MAAGDIFQITDVQVLHGKGLANVWYLEVLDDTGTTDALADAAAAFDNQVIAQLVAGQSNELNHDCLLVRRVFPTTSPVEVVDVSRLGSKAQDSLASNVAVTCRKYSGNGSINERNRNFVAGIPEPSVNQGRLTESASPDFAGFLAAIVAVITDSGRTYRAKTHSVKNASFGDLEEAELNPRLTKVRNRTPGICVIA